MRLTFIGIYEPCEGKSFISSIKRLKVLDKKVLDKTVNNVQTGNGEVYQKHVLNGMNSGISGTVKAGDDCQDGNHQEEAVGIEIKSTNGCSDLIMAANMKNRGILVQPEWGVETDAAFCVIRKDENGKYKATLMKGSYLKFGEWKFETDSVVDVYETSF